MRRALILTVVVSLLVSSLAFYAAAPQAAKAQDQKAKNPKAEKAYICTSCEYVGDKPGKCPKCGKDLVAVNKTDVYYECDMCHVKSEKPGKCPKCGMNMTLKVKSADKPSDSKSKDNPGKT